MNITVEVEAEVDLRDYFNEILYMFKNDKKLAKKLLSKLEKLDLSDLSDLDDERVVNLHKILSNYWKLTQDEDEFIKKLANKF